VGDIRKMYHTIKIEGVDQQTNRFLWRDLEERVPDVYVITSVSFGDKPAAAIAAVALKKTAEMAKDEFQEASETIVKNTYVDDVIDSVSDHDVASLRTKQIDEVLARGGFKIKGWRMSGQEGKGDKDVSTVGNLMVTKTDDKVLGVVWNSSDDLLEFRTKLNFSNKHRKVRVEPDIQEGELLQRIPNVLTKRLLLSQVNGIYDPMGLASPFVVRAKILLRKLGSLKLDWDEAIPEEERNKWA